MGFSSPADRTLGKGKFKSELIGDSIENSGIFFDARKISSKVFGSNVASGFSMYT